MSATRWVAAAAVGTVVYLANEPAPRKKSHHRVMTGSKWDAPDKVYRDGLRDVGSVGAWWRMDDYYDGDPAGFAAWRRHSGVHKPSAAALKAYG